MDMFRDERYAARRRSKRAAGSQRVEKSIPDRPFPITTKKPRILTNTGLLEIANA